MKKLITVSTIFLSTFLLPLVGKTQELWWSNETEPKGYSPVACVEQSTYLRSDSANESSENIIAVLSAGSCFIVDEWNENGHNYIEARFNGASDYSGYWIDSSRIYVKEILNNSVDYRSVGTTTIDQYIPGSCATLRELGLSNFRPGDPNYTSARDRDGDGIACEN